MTSDAGPAARFAGCAGEALDRCRTALASIQQRHPRSWIKQNAFGRAEVVSEADLAIEDILVSAFTSLFPELPIVAEEGHPNLPAIPGTCIIIDPIDGTIPFLRESPLYTITICRVEDSQPVQAIVDFPAYQVRVQALAGEGISVQGDIVRLPGYGPRSVLVSPAQVQLARDAGRDAGFEAVVAVPTTSVKMILVALGRADAAVRAPSATASVAPWDYVASALLMREAGGFVRDDLGRDLARSAPSVVSGWLACRDPGFSGPLRQVMASVLKGEPGAV
jgi:myo-inositol-1(or 4)-monophosphatase